MCLRFSPASIWTTHCISTITIEDGGAAPRFRTRSLSVMDLASAKMIGAGLASIALIGAGVGIGIIFGNYLAGALRNPGAAQTQFTNLLIGFALCEFTGLLGVVMAFIILFT